MNHWKKCSVLIIAAVFIAGCAEFNAVLESSAISARKNLMRKGLGKNFKAIKAKLSNAARWSVRRIVGVQKFRDLARGVQTPKIVSNLLGHYRAPQKWRPSPKAPALVPRNISQSSSDNGAVANQSEIFRIVRWVRS